MVTDAQRKAHWAILQEIEKISKELADANSYRKVLELQTQNAVVISVGNGRSVYLTRLNRAYQQELVPGKGPLLELLRKEQHEYIQGLRSRLEGACFKLKGSAKEIAEACE